MDRGMRNGERGAVFGIDFYTAGTKMFPVPVPGTAFLERGMHPHSMFPMIIAMISRWLLYYYYRSIYYKTFIYLSLYLWCPDS